MKPLSPQNDLDRAIIALCRSQSNMPDFMRALLHAGELSFPMRYHPELEDATLHLENGSPVPFVLFKEKDKEFTPLFSCAERLEESMRKSRTPAKAFLVGSMAAEQVLEILGQLNWNACINYGCSTGGIHIGPDLMRDLASGQALSPTDSSPGNTVKKTLAFIDPADYPTYLVQPLFEYMRSRPCFRAAWIFMQPKNEPPDRPVPLYYLLVLMEPLDETAFHDFNLIANSVSAHKCEVDLSKPRRYQAAEAAQLFQLNKPFFIAADFQPPLPPTE
jgi:hypothetical protein